MTRRELSEATLDAIAATRSTRSLADAIELHRALFRDDLWVERLAADEPPVFTDGHTGERTADPMSKLGPTLSWPLTRFISSQYGTLYPWSRSFVAMRELLCRKTHPQHLRRLIDGKDVWRGSLCAQLVSFAIRRLDPTTGLHFTVPQICQVLGVSPDRAGRTLHHALRWIEADMDRRRELQEQRQKADAGQHDWREAPHVHRPLGGLHGEECPQCRVA